MRVLILFLILVGCGPIPGERGLFVDISVEQKFASEFEEVKLCMGQELGRYEELSITVMLNPFDCPEHLEGCGGRFTQPNIIRIGNFASWKHEVVHYLLDVNTGDLDPEHLSHFFTECT